MNQGGTSCRDLPGQRRIAKQTSFVQLEDPNLHELGDGEVFEAALLHALDEFRGDLEDANLDQLVEGGLVSEGADLADFLGIDALYFEADQLVGIGHLVAEGGDSMNVLRIDVEDA